MEARSTSDQEVGDDDQNQMITPFIFVICFPLPPKIMFNKQGRRADVYGAPQVSDKMESHPRFPSRAHSGAKPGIRPSEVLGFTS